MEQKVNRDDYLSIGEFSKISGISRKNLIYYDNIGLFSPEITLANGYRFYYYRQLYAVNMICTLKDIGVPLKKIKEYTENINPERLIELFGNQLNNVEAEISKLTQIRDMMVMRIEDALTAQDIRTDAIELHHFKAEPIFVSKNLQMIEGQRVTFSKMLTRFYQHANSQGYHTSFPYGTMVDLTHYDETIDFPDFQYSDEFKNAFRFYYRVPISNTYKPAGGYLVLYTYGFDFEQRSAIYRKIIDYAKKHSLKLRRELYEDYLVNEVSTSKPEDYLVRITIPIE